MQNETDFPDETVETMRRIGNDFIQATMGSKLTVLEVTHLMATLTATYFAMLNEMTHMGREAMHAAMDEMFVEIRAKFDEMAKELHNVHH